MTQDTPEFAGRPSRLRNLNTTRTSEQPRPRIRPRGIPPALETHEVYSTLDPGRAAQLGRDLLGAHHITPDDPTAFHALYHAVLFRDITLSYLDFGTTCSIDVEQLTDSHLIILPGAGTCEVKNNGEVATATPVNAIVPKPGSPMTLRGNEQTALVILRIETRALGTHLSHLLGHSLDRDLVFDLSFDLSAPTASRWNFAVQMLHAELFDQGSLLHQGIGIGPLEDFVMSALFYTHTSTYSEQLTEPARHQRRSVRAAQDHIQRNLKLPITVEQVAEAAGISLRSLQNFFREDLDQTPTAYIRNLRLERSRADLADATRNSGISVTEVASKWGFHHHGRFASSYRARFGETPSQTLRS